MSFKNILSASFFALILIFPLGSFAKDLQPKNIWKEVEFFSDTDAHKLREYEGKTVLVMFWATWCPYCTRQMPALSMLKNLYKNVDDFEVIAISTDRGGIEKIKSYYETANIHNLDLFYDYNSRLMKTFGILGIPTIVLISKEGEILGSYSGLQHLDVNYLERLINYNSDEIN